MNRWAYTEVSLYDENRPVLVTTEPSVVDELFSALQQLIPAARVSRKWGELGVCHAQFERVDDWDRVLGFWIAAKLGELGWEPFARLPYPDSQLAFRKAIPE